MSRQKLIDIATRYIEIISTKPLDTAAFSEVVASDVKVPIPYPGSTPDYAGVLAITQAGHAAAPDFKVSIRQVVVDDVASYVVVLANVTGTHIK